MRHARAKIAVTGLALVMALAGCSGGDNKPAGEAGGKTAETPPAAPKTEKPTKLRVELWDRSNAAEGTTITNNFLTNWIRDEVAKIGIDIEFVPVPRATEEEKLNVWMASGEAPDVIFVYNPTVMMRYAEQGGLHELTPILDKFPKLKEANKVALETAGLYKGKRYAIPARVEATAGPSMKIRQDWLEKLNLKMPTSNDELYAVLKAFKEKDPGGVGKDNVVPWGLSTPSQGTKSFWYGPAYGFGVKNHGPGGILYMPSGNYKNGSYISGWVSPEGKNLFKYMNQAYKDGLIPKEFVTDVNNQKLTQGIANGTIGFLDSNDQAQGLNSITRKAVPTAKWVPVPPFKQTDGTIETSTGAKNGMLIMIPKSSKVPEVAMKYLDWMAVEKNIATILGGIEGTHYKKEDGLNFAINPDQRKKDLYAAGDLGIVYNGSRTYTLEQFKKLQNTPENPDAGELAFQHQEIFQKYGVVEANPDVPRPIATKSNPTFAKFLWDSISKVIIASDFDKEFGAMVDGWKKLGGDDYDKEVAEALKAMKK